MVTRVTPKAAQKSVKSSGERVVVIQQAIPSNVHGIAPELPICLTA